MTVTFFLRFSERLFIHQGGYAGQFLASKNSSDAPPPVETCVICFATPAFFTALAESPPPITVVAPDAASNFAMANVPSANLGISKTPIGPFQTINLAPFNAALNASMDFGPISITRQPAGTLSTSTTLLFASASNLSAITASAGRSNLLPAFDRMDFAVSMDPASTRLSCMA